MPHTLRSFLDQLDGRLLRVREPVDPISQIGVLCSESSGPVLFENLTGFPGWTLCDTLVKGRESQALALGCEPREVVPWLARRMYNGTPARSVLVPEGPVQEVKLFEEDIDVARLPIPVHSQGDMGRYLGSGVTITRDPDSGVCNEAFIRAVIKGPRKFGIWMAARHNWAHYLKYQERNQPMPMAFAIGLHPAYEILANYSGPHPTFDELELGAHVLGETLERVRCQTIDLEVPAHAEIVIEGVVPPHVREPEGPFGEFTAYRSGAEGPAPVFEVTAITHRRNPVFRHVQSTLFTDHQPLVCLPMEATYYRRLRETHGDTQVHDVHVAPWASMFIMLIQMTPRWEGQARDVLLSALSGPNLHPKVAIAVDDDVDIYNAQEVLWALSTRVDPARDVIILPHERVHPLDISVPVFAPEVTVMRVGGKMAIDATKPPLWRPADRQRFERVIPSGADDPALDSLRQRVRQPRPAAPGRSGAA